MFKSPASVEKLANQLARLPGIGRKSAARLAFHILKLSKQEAEELAEAIREVKDKVGFCSVCNNISETDPCRVCSDPARDRSLIC
ncbi:MAG: recombination protein RecR, partial [Candidatus Zixiibacteriota bacterium]